MPLDVAAFLRERLLRGDWARVLPGETELARELQVGRNTIRAALAVLEKDGLIRTASGKRREVVGKVKKLRRSMEEVAVMLLPVPWHTLAPSTLLWMDALRARLQGAVDRLVYGDRRDPLRAVARMGDRVAEQVISLPMHPYLDEAAQRIIIEAVRAACIV